MCLAICAVVEQGGSCGRIFLSNLAVAVLLDGSGPHRFAEPLSEVDHRHRLVAAATDRHDGRAVRRFQPAIRSTHSHVRAAAVERVDVLGLHGGGSDARLPVFLSG